MLDDTPTLRGIVVTWTLRFNDVLDPEKLHASLSKLLEIGDWKKVGGRLRLREDNGELEIHVPRPFTPDRPAVAYTHQTLAVDVGDHPLAKTLPRITDRPSIQAGPGEFACFAARDGAPSTLDDFLYQDVPQLSLHITSFNNATLVGLSWPHTLMDVMGQQALLRGWSLVLAGREQDVPPVLGAKEDAICAAADTPVQKGEEQEPFRLGEKRLTGLAMLKFGLKFGSDLLWNPVVETRAIFLPQRAVAELRRRAHEDLIAEQGGSGGETPPFVSEGDVLTAWATRVLASSLPQPRPLTVLHALNARFRLPSLLAQESTGVYVQNMAVAACTFFSHDTATGPLGPAALTNRQHLAEQATASQVLACLRELRKQPKKDSDPSLVCGESADAVLVPFTNWTRADVFKTADFAPAVVRAGDVTPGRINPPGTIVFHHAGSMSQGPQVRNVFVLLGKDHEDNCWMTAMLLPRTWAKMEEELKAL
jgi:hypothetical protein